MDTSLIELCNIALLFLLGVFSRLIFSRLRMPVPGMLGTIVVIGFLRVMQVPLPVAPPYFSTLMQVLMGIYVGSKVNQESIKTIKQMLYPALIIAAWVLGIAFIFGGFLSTITQMDLYTAILSTSIGGVPEMTVIALATDADIAMVVIMQTVRMVVTTILYPFIISFMDKRQGKPYCEVSTSDHEKSCLSKNLPEQEEPGRTTSTFLKGMGIKIAFFLIAFLAGITLAGWGVPAGAIVGSMLVTTFIYLGINVQTKLVSPKIFELVLIGVGIMVSNNITGETVETLLAGDTYMAVLVFNLFIFLSSIAVACLLYKITAWDIVTCLLATAPGGFTLMTALSAQYRKDPFLISMLHFGRLFVLKLVIPFTFMAIL